MLITVRYGVRAKTKAMLLVVYWYNCRLWCSSELLHELFLLASVGFVWCWKCLFKVWRTQEEEEELIGQVKLWSKQISTLFGICVVCVVLQLSQRRVFDTSSTYVRGEENLQVSWLHSNLWHDHHCYTVNHSLVFIYYATYSPQLVRHTQPMYTSL